MRSFAETPKTGHETKTVGPAKPAPTLSGRSRGVHSTLSLHTAIGGHAARRLSRSQAVDLEASARSDASAAFAYDFSRIPVRGNVSHGIQQKLEVSAPGGQYEKEADRVAEQVMRRGIPEEESAQEPDIQANAPQRVRHGDTETTAVDLETRVRAATLHGEPLPAKGGVLDNATLAELENEKKRGQPLPRSARDYFVSRLGRELGAVRIHTDRSAEVLSERVHARAFTLGQDIYFATGAFMPDSEPGRCLIAHELGHVLQQEDNPELSRVIQRSPESEGYQRTSESFLLGELGPVVLEELKQQAMSAGDGVGTYQVPNGNLVITYEREGSSVTYYYPSSGEMLRPGPSASGESSYEPFKSIGLSGKIRYQSDEIGFSQSVGGEPQFYVKSGTLVATDSTVGAAAGPVDIEIDFDKRTITLSSGDTKAVFDEAGDVEIVATSIPGPLGSSLNLETREIQVPLKIKVKIGGLEAEATLKAEAVAPDWSEEAHQWIIENVPIFQEIMDVFQGVEDELGGA